MLDIKFIKTESLKEKPAKDKLLGNSFTDYMFTMQYAEGKGWHNPIIEPYRDLGPSPSSMFFYYNQGMFDTLKAYKSVDGKVCLFRPDTNAKRTNRSYNHLCIPSIPEEDFVQAVSELVSVERDWLLEKDGAFLCVRPFVINNNSLGAENEKTYSFVIILSPSIELYEGAFSPVGISVDYEYTRTVNGVTEVIKTGDTQTSKFIAQSRSHSEGFSQVLWLDSADHKYFENTDVMTLFFKIGGKIITPEINGDIIPNITRDWVIDLVKAFDTEVEERKISIDELFEAYKNGLLEEVFITDLSTVISPVNKLRYKKEVMTIGDGGIGELSQKIYNTLTGIQSGALDDPFGWRVEIK